MSTLAHFPMVSQLTSTTSDGKPSENSQFDCVPASIGACILWFQDKSQWDNLINPDKLKDAVYGETYKGGTAATAYVPFCKQLGYDLYPLNTSSAMQSVEQAHKLLAANKPVIFTEKDPYVPASYGWSHVCVFYAESAGELSAMDPYIGKAVTKSDAEWEQVLLANQLWLVAPLEDDMSIDIHSPGVSESYTEQDAHHWLCKNGHTVQFGILDFYKSNNGLLLFGLPLSNEIPTGTDTTVLQYFERACLVYDPAHKLDNPPGAGSVYTAHVYDVDASHKALGRDPYLAKLEETIAQLQAQPANDQALLDKINQIKQIVG